MMHALTAQHSDKEDGKMDTSEPPATLPQPPKHGCTTNTIGQKT